LTACSKRADKKTNFGVFTNLFEISKTIRSTFNRASSKTEQDLINQFSLLDCIILDDLGTEIFTKNDADTWTQTLVFDLINHRYNAKKPTIFSSNHSINDLVTIRGLMEKTADRICQMTSGAVIKITGKSFRTENQGPK
jgi:DNA replication protein DnaC